MKVKFKDKEVELKYTFNSFKYMDDLNTRDLLNFESTPFKVVTIASQLLLGAANNSKNVIITPDEIDEYLENAIENETFDGIVTSLITLLIESSFFKHLQKNKK